MRSSTFLRRDRLAVLTGAIGVLLSASTARAQTAAVTGGFSMNRFEPAERGSEWFSQDSLDLRGSGRAAIGLTVDYAYRPERLGSDPAATGPTQSVSLVSSQLFAHLGASFVFFDRVRLGLDLPIALINSGDSVTQDGVLYGPPSGGGIGDPRLGLDIRLSGKFGDVLTTAIGADVWLPVGSASNYLGDGSVRFEPHFRLAGDSGDVAYAAGLGYLLRGTHTASLAGQQIGDELRLGGSIGLRFDHRHLLVGPEFYAATVTTGSGSFLGTYTTDLEVILGAHYTTGDWRIGAGAGPGVTNGVGTPTLRVLLSLEWAPTPKKKSTDSDGDGIRDKNDACPDVPGVKSDDPAKNGCPDDGAIDTDGDGVADTDDACVEVKGIKTDDPKTNGCPVDRDSDGDGIVDSQDACPDHAGPADPDPKRNGCPTVRVEHGQVKILDQIKFKTGSAEILRESMPIVEAVAKVLKEVPEIKKLRVEGHTDNRGSAAGNKDLSKRRAAAVMAALVRLGIESGRLESVGYGDEKPIETNDTDAGRTNNRRVEFHIIDGAIPDATTPPKQKKKSTKAATDE
ncbi:MAG: OmpA family protein [Polyangiales bacterium]